MDAKNRDQVVSFWQAVYRASEGYQNRANWSGQFPDKPGKSSNIFLGDVERRINYFRAMCGVAGDARLNTGSTLVISNKDQYKPSPSITKQSAAQEMAMLIVASYDPLEGELPGMSHDPDPELELWTESAWNAAVNSNLAFGAFGPGAVTEYVTEELPANSSTSDWNSLVGHRRWILFPRATNYASGDFPGESALLPPTNVLYITQSSEESRPAPSVSFVSYPPAGFFPAHLNGRFWSLSRRQADFSQAAVTIRDAAGKKVPVSDVQADSSFGTPALVWRVDGPAAARRTTSDRRFQVEVKGILVDGVPISHSYQTTLINPELLRKNSPIKGKRKIKVRSREKYKIKPIKEARSSRLIQYQRTSRAWTENGDGKKPAVVDNTAPVYPLLAEVVGKPNGAPISGSKSFNLTFPISYDLITRTVPEQNFELDGWFQTKNGSLLEFDYTRGIMSAGTAMVVEISTDQGSSWTSLGQEIRGKVDPQPDQGVTKASYKLPRAKKPIRIRFRYFFADTSGALATHEGAGSFPTGIFLDNIKVSKTDWFRPRKTSKVKGKSFRLRIPKKSKAGERWTLSLESEFGDGWLPVGPFRTVRVVKK